jgi:hypothetical protein
MGPYQYCWGETAPSSTAADPVGAEFSGGSYLDVIDTESLPLTPLTSVVRVTSPLGDQLRRPVV